ncbi:MAG: aminotransferase class I/II-fold pyridoxal phosphate-dependent enzyme [Bryobacterales bacterium]
MDPSGRQRIPGRLTCQSTRRPPSHSPPRPAPTLHSARDPRPQPVPHRPPHRRHLRHDARPRPRVPLRPRRLGQPRPGRPRDRPPPRRARPHRPRHLRPARRRVLPRRGHPRPARGRRRALQRPLPPRPALAVHRRERRHLRRRPPGAHPHRRHPRLLQPRPPPPRLHGLRRAAGRVPRLRPDADRPRRRAALHPVARAPPPRDPRPRPRRRAPVEPLQPHGQRAARRRAAGLRRHLPRLGVVLILDEFYAHYLYDDAQRGDGPSLSAARYVEDVDRDPVVLLDGLTKNWRYPGWRLAWTVGPKWLVERLASAGSFLDGGPAHPLQRAAIPLLEREVANAEARAIQAAFGRKRDLTLDRLRAMGITVETPPQGSFYAFGSLRDLPEPLRDGMALFDAALGQQVIVVPGQFFDVNPGKRRSHIPSRLRGYVRFSFGPDIEQVRMGLDRLDTLVREAPSR